MDCQLLLLHPATYACVPAPRSVIARRRRLTLPCLAQRGVLHCSLQSTLGNRSGCTEKLNPKPRVLPRVPKHCGRAPGFVRAGSCTARPPMTPTPPRPPT